MCGLVDFACSHPWVTSDNLAFQYTARDLTPVVPRVDSTPWWKTLQDLLRSLKILADLQRSWKTRIFQGSLKDLAQILEDP